jgi:Spy/CpxP family protein refolding chaperone
MSAFVLAALAMSGTPARPAQQQRLVPEEGAVEIMLLRQESVQQDLKLTPTEAERIRVFASQQWKKAQEIDRLGADERRQRFTAMTRENEQFLGGVLQPEQRKRLNQIALQVAGLLWVTRPGVADELRLTEDQKAKARQLQETARREMRDLLETTTRENRSEKLKELRATSRKRLMDLLTDEQEAKWKEMTGPRFEGRLGFDPDEVAK